MFWLIWCQKSREIPSSLISRLLKPTSQTNFSKQSSTELASCDCVISKVMKFMMKWIRIYTNRLLRELQQDFKVSQKNSALSSTTTYIDKDSTNLRTCTELHGLRPLTGTGFVPQYQIVPYLRVVVHLLNSIITNKRIGIFSAEISTIQAASLRILLIQSQVVSLNRFCSRINYSFVRIYGGPISALFAILQLN